MERLRTAFERCAKTLTLQPSRGRATGVSRTRIRQGLTCEVEEGPWKLTADMPKSVGGDASAPTPGVLGRAALGSCLAICYMMHAAKLGVPIAALEVEVQTHYDNGALFGVSDVPAGYLDVRYTVTVESTAPEADIQRVLDEGDAHSPYLDVFSRAQACRRTVRIISPSREAAPNAAAATHVAPTAATNDGSASTTTAAFHGARAAGRED